MRYIVVFECLYPRLLEIEFARMLAKIPIWTKFVAFLLQRRPNKQTNKKHFKCPIYFTIQVWKLNCSRNKSNNSIQSCSDGVLVSRFLDINSLVATLILLSGIPYLVKFACSKLALCCGVWENSRIQKVLSKLSDI